MREQRLRALGPKTTAKYKYVLDRAWPGVSAGLEAPLGTLPTAVPAAVQNWPESTKVQLCAAVYRVWRIAGRTKAEADAVVSQVPGTLKKKKAPYQLPDKDIDAFEARAERERPRDRAVALLLLRMGFRSEELLRLRRVDVLRAVHGGADGKITFVGKGNKERELPTGAVNDLFAILLDIQ